MKILFLEPVNLFSILMVYISSNRNIPIKNSIYFKYLKSFDQCRDKIMQLC